ncbi:MAG: DUF262 domain-containing protein [Nitrospira sp.]|nr:DUF262 domain-containing protein [Nitrospira sp.]
MKAEQTTVERFLGSHDTQFVIPVYQRNYDWTSKQCEQLLKDILAVGRSSKEETTHFIGSIVYVHHGVVVTSRLRELTVIDGQQRLTTLILIYMVIQRLALQMGDGRRAERIRETYLINKWEGELKLLPTENNKRALEYLLSNDPKETFPEFSRVVENFGYFKERINEENYECVMSGLSKLVFVEISLEKERDDPQRIFESLNSTGLALSQADLIRNYILMDLNRDDQNKIYREYWQMIEKLAKVEKQNKSQVSEFIRDYLTLKNKKIPNKGMVFQEFKDKYKNPAASVEELERNLTEIRNLARHYHKLLNPNGETDKDIRRCLEYINSLDMTVAFPFLMQVYDDYSNRKIDKETFIKVLDLIQSFVCRRFIVGLPTNSLNKIFMSLYGKVDISVYLLSIQKSLIQKTGVQRYPKNEEVKKSLRDKEVYHLKHHHRMYLLERLENYPSREQVLISGNPDITVEHIFPQNPGPKWERDLGKQECVSIKEHYLHTIGNLTLVANNAKLGNKPFLEKRDLKEGGFKASKLWLNKDLSTLDKWDSKAIEKRFDRLYERFLKIWEYPAISLAEETGNGETRETNIFEADDPTGKKLEYAIFLEGRIEVSGFTELYAEVFGQLFELHPETFFSTDLAQGIGLTKNPQDLRDSLPITDTYFIEKNMDNKAKFEKIKQALEEFGLEDELFIKYRDDT